MDTCTPSRTTRYSTVGKPRRVTDSHIARILTWHRNRISAKHLAREPGLWPSTLRAVVKTDGRHYKKPSPA